MPIFWIHFHILPLQHQQHADADLCGLQSTTNYFDKGNLNHMNFIYNYKASLLPDFPLKCCIPIHVLVLNTAQAKH